MNGNAKGTLRKPIACVIGTIAISLSLLTGCATVERIGHNVESEVNGGLDRVAILYDYNGNEIRRWEGTIDIKPTSEASQAGRILFDLDGKRTIVEGGIFVVQEK